MSRRPSPALVVAIAALAVALGGGAVAAIGAIPSDGRFAACYQTSDSILNRIVLLAEPGEECPNTYARVSWPLRQRAGRRALLGLRDPQARRVRQVRPGPQGHADRPEPPARCSC
jgi:hypothetical protein